MKKRFLWPLAIFIVLVGFLAVGLKRDPSLVPSPLVGKPAPVSVNAVVGGRAVERMRLPDGSPASLAIRYAYADRTAYFWAFFGPADESVVNALVSGFTPRPDGDPSQWPISPFE